MAQIFAHNEHILVDGKKMAKSANNFYTLQDIIDRGYDPLAFRLLVLQAHYRSQAHFSWKNLDAAQNRLNDYRRVADLKFQPAKQEGVLTTEKNAGFEELLAALTDDLDSPQALAVLSSRMELIKVNPPTAEQIPILENFLRKLDDLFGLQLSRGKDILPSAKDLIAEREKAREANDWAKSDEVRKQLEAQGIGLRDTAQGTIWHRL